MYEPTVPPIIRTIVYSLGLIVGFATLLVVGLTAIYLDPADSAKIAAAAGVIGTAVGWLASALGVMYRPTGNHAYLEHEQARRAADDTP